MVMKDVAVCVLCGLPAANHAVTRPGGLAAYQGLQAFRNECDWRGEATEDLLAAMDWVWVRLTDEERQALDGDR